MNNDFQQQVKLDQIANQKRREMVPIVERRMKEDKFPESLPQAWVIKMRKAVRKIQPYSVKARLGQFAHAVCILSKPDPHLSLNDFQIIADSTDVISMDQFELSEEEYKSFVDQTLSLVDIWKKAIKQVEQDAAMEVESNWQLKTAVEKGLKAIKE